MKKTTELHNFPSGSVVVILLDACIVFVSLLLIYSLTFSGSFRVDDEHILVARAQSLAFGGHIHYPQIYGNDRVRHLSVIPEDIASPVVAIEPGQAVLGSILYKFASAVKIGGAQAYFVLNLYATALTGALIYLIIRLWGFRRSTALMVAFLYGLATMAWPYSKTAFRDPLAALMTTVAVLGWVIYLKKAGRVRISGLIVFLGGIFGGLFFKSNVLVLFPAFLISGIILGYRPNQTPRIDGGWILISLLPLVLFVILALIVSNPGPLSRISVTYLLESVERYWGNLNIQTLLATLGPFFSPSKSIFLFNPIFLILPWVVLRSWREMKQIALPTILSTVFLTVFQALHLRELWAGTLFWGLRFMLPVLPMLALLLAPWVEWLISPGFNRTKGMGWFLIGSSIMVQLAGAIVAWHTPFKVWSSKGLDPVALDAVWRFEFLVIPIHLRRLFSPPSWDIAWIRTLINQSWAGLIPVIILLLLFFLRKSFRRSGAKEELGWPSYVSFFLPFVLAFSFPICPSLWLLQVDPDSGGGRPELTAAVDWVKEMAEEGDLVVVDSYGTDLWKVMMNEWDSSVPWYSLPHEFPGHESSGSAGKDLLSDAEFDLFQELGISYSRLIYLTSEETPEYALKREEGWFSANASLVAKNEFFGSTRAEVSIYSP